MAEDGEGGEDSGWKAGGGASESDGKKCRK